MTEFNLSQNYFELFDLPVMFNVNVDEITGRYRVLQKALHPDRYADKSDQEKRMAVQAAAKVNMAFEVLKQPLDRAIYILELNGIDTKSETDTKMNPMFLMMQMEWREALDEAQDFDVLDKLTDEVSKVRKENLQQIEGNIESAKWDDVRNGVRELQFIEKMKSEIALKEEQLEDY